MEGSGEGQEEVKEVTKRWGFRRSTIAKREFMEEIGTLDFDSTPAPRRGTRQDRGRGRGRGKGKEASGAPAASPAPRRRGGRRSAPEPPPTPAEEPMSSSDPGGGDGACLHVPQQNPGNSAKPSSNMALGATSDIEATSEAAASDQAEDSDDLTLRELQERARNRKKLEEVGASSVMDLKVNSETVHEGADEKKLFQSEDSNDVQVTGGAWSSGTAQRDSRSPAVSTKGQKAASVGIEEDGKQKEESNQVSHDSSEENDPDALYCICRQKHNNRFMICCDRCQEWFHGDCVGITEARGRLLEENGEDYICPSCSPCQSPVEQPVLSPSSESLVLDRPRQDRGIRGKIRKATTASTKRKFKIFQPEEAETVQKAKEEKEEEKLSAVPKCIGPGCDSDALPESVYCGHQCIIRHAAMAMQTISEPKTPLVQTKTPKPIPQIQKKMFLEKLFRKKMVEKPVKEEGGGSKEVTVSLETEEPITAPLPRAAGGQESPLTPSVFYKSTVKKEKEDVESKVESKQDTPPDPPPDPPLDPPASSENSEKTEDSEKTEKEDKIAGPLALPVRKPGSKPLPSRAKKTMPGSPRLAVLRQLQTEPPQVSRSSSSGVGQLQDAPAASTSAAPEIRVLPVALAPVPPPRPLQAHPNMQMRQNIRRSLTDTLLKRASESEHLDMCEGDVEKLAVNIEREMFNMFYTTDSKYRNKYRTLLLSLKDPKNKGLFYGVMRGQITPFKLTRLSQQELQCLQEVAAASHLKEESPPVDVNTEELCEDKAKSIGSSSEENAPVSQVKHVQPRKVGSAVSDIISSMLKDTTSEHKTHLFDLKCRICTGQNSADKDSEAKKFKKEESRNEDEEKMAWVIQMFDKKNPDPAPGKVDPVMESPASPTADDSNVEAASSDFSPLVIPEVSVVSITRRDPRTAGYRPAAPPTVASAPAPGPPQCPPPVLPAKETVEETKAADPLPPPPPMLKSILMKPSIPSVPRFYTSPSSTTRPAGSHSPTESETSQFLSKQDTVWKGFLNMQNVAKFVTKAYLISGSGPAELLKKDLPDTVHIGGRILPQTVWEYVEKVKTSVTKEMSLIRFHPATDEEEVAYVSLFSYFNSRRRFGVVSNICNNIKDLYLIPLCAKESIPSMLLPLDGPGLEEQHPNLLIGLAICQKLKRFGTVTQETDEKRPRMQTPLDPQGVTLPVSNAVPDVKPDESEPYDPGIPISTTPPVSSSPPGSPDSASPTSGSMSDPSLLSSILSKGNLPSSVSACTTKFTTSNPPAPSLTCPSSSTTPLQTILNTLFGKKRQDSVFPVDTCEPGPSALKEPSASAPTVDPIVQQYQQTPKNTTVERTELDDNDRPYDPEEEYDPGIGYQNVTTSSLTEMSETHTFTAAAAANEVTDDDDRPYDPEEEYNLGKKVDTSTNATESFQTKESVDTSAINSDIAYDPEDETVFEEMQTYLADKKPSNSQYEATSTVSLSEQQKMLEELNRQIEEQKRQLEEQEEALRLQRAAVGVSMAHFSVSEALMSPPPRFGRDLEEATGKTLAVPTINPSRDPRQCRNLREDAVGDILDNGKGNSLSSNQALTQATFLAPSNQSEPQDLSKPEQEHMVKKDSEMPSVTSADTKSSNIDKKELHFQANTPQSPSELEEGACTSSGNENSQHSHSHLKASGKTRQSRSSKWDYLSSPKRRLKHERKLRHEERSSRVSRDEADRDRRRSRHSPDRSSRQSSRSRRHREERVSSRQRDWHHHRSTSSRHRSRRDRHSSRSHSDQSGKSAQLENAESCQRDPSPSKKTMEYVHSADQAQSIEQVASGPPHIQSDKLQNEASEDSNKNVSNMQKGSFTETDNNQTSQKGPSFDPPDSSFSLCDQLSQKEHLQVRSNPMQRGNFSQPDNENKPAPEPLLAQRHHSNKDLEAKYQNRDGSEVLKDNFCLSELPLPRDSGILANPQAGLLSIGPQSFHSGKASQPVQHHDNKAHPAGKNPSQRKESPQDESDRFYHRNQPRSDRTLMLKNKDDLFHNRRSNVVRDETVFSCQRNEQTLSSLHSSDREVDHRKPLPQKTLQRREGFSEYDQRYSGNKLVSERPKMQSGHFSGEPDKCFNREPLARHPSSGHRSNFPEDDAQQMDQNNDFAQDRINQPKPRSHLQRPPHMQGRDFTLRETGPNLPESQMYVDETDKLHHDAERYLGHFPEDEAESGHQRHLPHRPPHLQEDDFLNPEAEQMAFKNNPPQNNRFSVDENDQFHHSDYIPQRAYSVVRADVSQEDIPRNFHPREQFRLRAPGEAWRALHPRPHGPRGPPSLMAPRGPAAMRPRMPRSHHPERFENCGPGQNFDTKGAHPRQRICNDFEPSPNLGPRSPSSVPGIFEESEPRAFGPRNPNPDSGLGPLNSGFRGRFPGPGNGPQKIGPRGSFSGYRPGPSHSQHVMARHSGPCQPRHEGPRDLFNIRGPPQQQFDKRDSKPPHVDDPRGHGAPHQFNREHFDFQPDVRVHDPPHQLDDEEKEDTDPLPPDFHGSGDCAPTHPLDDTENNRGFLVQHTKETRRPAPRLYSDESKSHYQNSANKGFSHPQERCGIRRRAHSQSEGPQFPEMESDTRRLQQFSEFGEQEDIEEPHFAKLDICEGPRDCESATQMKGPRFNPIHNFRGQRAPSPHFQGQRMPRFPSKMAPTSTHLQRPPQLVQPQVRFDSPSKEPDVRPLRLSGPLLPTPPGGPIILPNPRMQKPYSEHSRPLGPPARAPSRMKPGRFVDNSNRPQRENPQSLIQERLREDLGNRGEDSSSQDSSPMKAGKPSRKRQRKREGRNQAARRQRIREHREADGEMARYENPERSADTNPKPL